jgi:hypothetical protein
VTGRTIPPRRGLRLRRLGNVVVGVARVARISLWQGGVLHARNAWFVRWPKWLVVCGRMVVPIISVPA